MTSPNSSLRPSSRVRSSTVFAAVGFAGSAGVLVWAVVGSLSEEDGRHDPDYLWEPSPFLVDHSSVIALVAGLVVLLTGLVLVRTRRRGALPGLRVAQVAVACGFGAWLGFGYRIVTAASTGANIGGGLVLLATPLAAILTMAAIVGLELAARRRTR